MEYYIYVSDEKVDMLASQIPEKRIKALARQLEVSVKLPWLPITATYKPGDPLPSDEQRIRRLRIVEGQLDAEGVGDIDDVPQWMRVSLEMHWGFIDSEQEAVWFLGKRNATTVVMCGSAKHLIGGARVAQQPHHAYSLLAVLTEALVRRAESLSELGEVDRDTRVFEAARLLAQSAGGPRQRLLCLARKLAARQLGDERVVLATPLYVISE